MGKVRAVEHEKKSRERRERKKSKSIDRNKNRTSKTRVTATINRSAGPCRKCPKIGLLLGLAISLFTAFCVTIHSRARTIQGASKGANSKLEREAQQGDSDEKKQK